MRGEWARRAFRDLVESAQVHGLLAFENEMIGAEPLAWMCLGPVDDFPRLDAVRALRHARELNTWAITCFYVRSRARRTGLGIRLLVVGQEYAFANGCRVLEGYPVNVRPRMTMPGAFAWTGVPAMFAAAGFQHLHRVGETRGIWIARAPER